MAGKQPLLHAGQLGDCLGDFSGGGGGERTKRDSGHASHLTGCGGQRRRERWLNGSDVGRLWGPQRWVPSRAGGKKRGLVNHRARQPHR